MFTVTICTCTCVHEYWFFDNLGIDLWLGKSCDYTCTCTYS